MNSAGTGRRVAIVPSERLLLRLVGFQRIACVCIVWLFLVDRDDMGRLAFHDSKLARDPNDETYMQWLQKCCLRGDFGESVYRHESA